MILPVLINDGKIVIRVKRECLTARIIGESLDGDVERTKVIGGGTDLYTIPLKELLKHALDFYAELKGDV